MAGFFNESLILKVGHRITVYVVGPQFCNLSRRFRDKYGVLSLVQRKDLKKLVLSDPHSERAIRHQHHLSPVNGGDKVVRQSAGTQLADNIPSIRYDRLSPYRHVPPRSRGWLSREKTPRLQTAYGLFTSLPDVSLQPEIHLS